MRLSAAGCPVRASAIFLRPGDGEIGDARLIARSKREALQTHTQSEVRIAPIVRAPSARFAITRYTIVEEAFSRSFCAPLVLHFARLPNLGPSNLEYALSTFAKTGIDIVVRGPFPSLERIRIHGTRPCE